MFAQPKITYVRGLYARSPSIDVALADNPKDLALFYKKWTGDKVSGPGGEDFVTVDMILETNWDVLKKMFGERKAKYFKDIAEYTAKT